MIKRIIAIADLHIPTYNRIEEYEEHLNDLLESVKNDIKDFSKDAIRILIMGDLFHNKNQVSNENLVTVSNFIRRLESLGRVMIIAGNHDFVIQNQNRLDTLTALFSVARFENSVFLDKELGYTSGVVEDENIKWALWSIYDNYAPINISLVERSENDSLIGLFHGTVVGCTMENGTSSENGIDGNMFDGCDIAIGGDIHKRQILKRKDTEIIYCGSFIQQDYGETITQHGYLILNISDEGKITHTFRDVSNNYGFYKIEIKSDEDIDEDKEMLLNY